MGIENGFVHAPVDNWSEEDEALIDELNEMELDRYQEPDA